MNVREFTADGLQEVHSLLDRLKQGEKLDVAAEMLSDDRFSVDLGVAIGSIPKTFESRYLMAVWLNKKLDPILRTDPVGSAGMWTWLTVLLLDVVAPLRADGTRKMGERALYVLESDNWMRYYRHLLAGPCRVMRAHWSELHITQALLAGKPNVPGELYEQVASRQEVITNAPLVRLTRRLYWDIPAQKLKRGVGGKGQGSARRLAGLLLQLDLTWDFESMDDDALIALLPSREFSRFARNDSVSA